MNSTYAVETFGLAKAYKTTLAVDHIDFKVPVGCTCGFLGKNGAGKTTTMKMLVGLKRPTSGEFAIMGKRETFGTGIRTVGYLPDVPDFYGYMTGTEFLRLCAKICNVPKDEVDKQVKSLLVQVGLDGVKTKISGYSRGMRQRLGIAQALVNNPSVVFMDEPISALDPMGRRDIMEIIGGLKGATIVLSTHILSDVENICDYVAIIHKGRIVAQDYMANLKKSFAKNLAKVNFYEDGHGTKFAEALQKTGKVAVTAIQPMQVMLKADDMGSAEISRMVAAALVELAIPFKDFAAHSPSLDDIFYEVIGDE